MKKHQKNPFWNIALFTRFNLGIFNCLRSSNYCAVQSLPECVPAPWCRSSVGAPARSSAGAGWGRSRRGSRRRPAAATVSSSSCGEQLDCLHFDVDKSTNCIAQNLEKKRPLVACIFTTLAEILNRF